LTVLTHTLVSRLLVNGTTVVGVEVMQDSLRRCYMAEHEVILSLGAVHTPKVLMQSGIGHEDELRRHGIGVVQHLPGVGQNHQDHVSFGSIFEYREPHAIEHGGSEATLCWSDASIDLPDLFHCQVEFPVPSAETASSAVPAHGWTMFAGLAHPKSRGELRLSGADVLAPILINANTLSHPDDIITAFASISLARELGGRPSFDALVTRGALPGKLDERAMENYLCNAAVTYWHQSCTAKMRRDSMSVVDNELSVYGVKNLRFADASIMPNVTSGNTMAPCVVIGERAAEMIKATQI
jgi:choline dehydrogenase